MTDQTNRFVRFVFRTTDVSAGRAFYASVLGDAVTDTTFVPLHEQALARGARPHWLGLLGVADVDAAARAVEARGGTRLGPTAPYFEGGELAVVRDPGGAIVGFGTPPATPLGTRVTWQLLNTTDLPGCRASYGEVLGWSFGAPQDLGEHGVLHPFACRAGDVPDGAMLDITGRAGRHPHWLFHFAVRSLDAAMAEVRTANGLVLGPFTLPDGRRIATCDDPQGAAFAMIEA